MLESATRFYENELKIKKMNGLAKLPTRGSKYSAGNDLYAATDHTVKIEPHKTAMIGTGLGMELPNGTFGAIFARSGIASKRGLRPANCVAVIDSDYRGEWIIPLHNDADEVQTIEAGERIAQFVVMPYFKPNIVEVNDLSSTERGEGGFGSTGTN